MTRTQLDNVIEYLEERLVNATREACDVVGSEHDVDHAGQNVDAIRFELLEAYRAFRAEVRRG